MKERSAVISYKHSVVPTTFFIFTKLFWGGSGDRISQDRNRRSKQFFYRRSKLLPNLTQDRNFHFVQGRKIQKVLGPLGGHYFRGFLELNLTKPKLTQPNLNSNLTPLGPYGLRNLSKKSVDLMSNFVIVLTVCKSDFRSCEIRSSDQMPFFIFLDAVTFFQSQLCKLFHYFDPPLL